tara:strand:- start:133 stop:594 length:462 start_codon:yes stop_codon:yes gene_type:complete
MRKLLFIMIAVSMVMLSSCSENYSNGERIGVITQFSQSGLLFKTWEGHLNVTQTGMNSSVPFDFSVDRDKPEPLVVATLDSAAQYGWKVKLVYHEVMGWNWFLNRGETDHFITTVEVLDKDFGHPFGSTSSDTKATVRGSTIDTIYVVIYRDK